MRKSWALVLLGRIVAVDKGSLFVPFLPARSRRWFLFAFGLLLPVLSQVQFDYTTSDGAVTITSLPEGLFQGCSRLQSVTLPNSIASIDQWVFSACASLQAVCLQGDAPEPNLSAFDGAELAVVCYLPSTTGWESTFSGRPALVWDPRIDTGDPGFGVTTDGFGFAITASNDLTVVVEASDSPGGPEWVPVGTNALTAGASFFNDPQWSGFERRFYSPSAHGRRRHGGTDQSPSPNRRDRYCGASK